MSRFTCKFVLFIATAALQIALPSVAAGSAREERPAFELPADWLAAWSHPPAELRPLQIVHGVPPAQATPEAMTKLKELGLGGIVCNVSFSEYMQSEAHWQTLIKAVEACRDTGLVVWIYDEDGYPSGAAGGLVLQQNPKFEALALAYDSSLPEPFILRPSYEHTHASNNFYASRRFANLLDREAVESFIKITHEAYWARLKDQFGGTIQAFFTDEPSLMAVNIGQLPEEVRKTVRVVDPLDESLKPLPSVPWVADLPQRYRQRYGEDILPVRKSLFEGDSEADRVVRRQFWALVTDLFAERYYGQIRRWTGSRKVASSGHILWEEQPLHGVPLEGNPLKMLMQMDIPGLDMLTSNPEAVIYSGWLTASLPASAAIFSGGRRVMTEVSDFSETMAEKGPAPLADMCAAAAWQAALGVTEFTLYYNRAARSPTDYRAYCDFVGRLNALLRDARPAPRVLLYYPIYNVWGEYKPVAEPLTLNSQNDRAKTVVNSFMSLGERMTRRQISFALIDHELLAAAEVREGRIVVNGRVFDALVLPAGVEMPKSAAEKMNLFKASGGKVLADGADGSAQMDALAALYGSGALGSPSERVIVGRFVRGGADILLIVNVAAKEYNGAVTAENASAWLAADPASGRIGPAATDGNENIVLSLPPRTALLLIGPGRIEKQAN